jgi:multidrug resistance efflux pump
VILQIKAPISGIINKRFIEPGSMLTAMPATQLFEIVNVNTLNYKRKRSQIFKKTGTAVTVTSSVYPLKNLKEKLRS